MEELRILDGSDIIQRIRPFVGCVGKEIVYRPL